MSPPPSSIGCGRAAGSYDGGVSALVRLALGGWAGRAKGFARPARLLLAAGLLLMAGGTVVAPHVDPPNLPPLHVDHVPSAYHLVLLGDVIGGSADEDAPSLVPVRLAAATLASLTLALLTLPFLFPWRSRALAAPARFAVAASPRWRAAPPHGPPRAS